MKKSRNFIISSLVALTGVTLASSVTGTVAWFQYATSASVAYTGTTVSCSKLLQISKDGGDWSTDLIIGKTNPAEFLPVTSGEIAKNGALPAKLSKGPTYRKENKGDWSLATPGVDYQQFTLSLRLNDVSDGAPGTLEAADICLSDLTIKNSADTDIDDAVRVHLAVSDGDKYLFSKSGTTIDVCGQLDLNNDGAIDMKGYDFDDSRTPYKYGGEGVRQGSYAQDDDSVIGEVLGNTGSAALNIVVTIWVEGWAVLATGQTGNAQTSTSAVWSNTKYTSNDFHVGMTFDVVE